MIKVFVGILLLFCLAVAGACMLGLAAWACMNLFATWVGGGGLPRDNSP